MDLASRFPHVALADLPTPVDRVELPGTAGLWVKRDDVSGAPYGGNKVRKLAFLLGRALDEGARAVITFGAAGSNHALATAIYSARHGLRCQSILVPQVPARSIRRNLLRGHAAGAVLHPSEGRRDSIRRVAALLREERARAGCYPHVIPPGGSSPVGALGFVNAAFELAGQLGPSDFPEVLYVASGTMGTCMGLLLGLALLGRDTRLEAVSVTTAPFSCPAHGEALFHATNRLLRAADPAIPELPFPRERFSFRTAFLGEGYGVHTEAGVRAVARARETAGIGLEGTYTGKTFAALLADAAAGMLAEKRVLFWDTYNSRDFSNHIDSMDYRALPVAFHPYFEDEVQPLDRA